MDAIDLSYVTAGTRKGAQTGITAAQQQPASAENTAITRHGPERGGPLLEGFARAPGRDAGRAAHDASGQGGAQQLRRELRFTVSEHSDRVVITVMDADSEEVIRQIPLEETMRVGEVLGRVSGLLLDTTA